ncbi:MAG: hypothetical protein OEZ41_10515, partial [Nitrospirota bacterium]|nr:hypothetical protein [Nitrospirota bacterium]
DHLCPEWASRRGLFERSEFPSHLASGRWRRDLKEAANGREWFWVLLPKQKDLVGGGETPLKKTPSNSHTA